MEADDLCDGDGDGLCCPGDNWPEDRGGPGEGLGVTRLMGDGAGLR